MSLRSSSLGFATILAAAAALSGFHAHGAEQHHGRSIEFSEPRSAESLTNMDQLTSKKNSLKQLEEDLYKPFAPKTSLDGFLDPPQRRRGPSPQQMKKAKERMDRQRNWAFVDPDDEAAGPSAEEILNLPEYDADGQEKKKLSVFEQYLQNQDRKQKGRGKDDKTNTGKAGAEDFYGAGSDSESWDSWDDSGSKDGKGLGDRERGMKKLFGTDNSSLSPVQRGTFTDIFGLGDTAPSAEDAAKHKIYLDEFRSLLNAGGKSPGAGFTLPATLPDASRSSLSAVGGWERFSGAAQPESPSSFSGAKSSFGFTPAQSSFSGKSFATPVSTPASAPAAKSTPTVPTFTAPRRSF